MSALARTVSSRPAGSPSSRIMPTDVRPPGRYLYDPDSAVVRAGLVDLLARDVGLWRLDDAEEYLSSDNLISSPFCTPFEVLALLGNNTKAVRQAVRDGKPFLLAYPRHRIARRFEEWAERVSVRARLP